MYANWVLPLAVITVILPGRVTVAHEESWMASWQRARPDDNLELFYAGDGLTEEVDVAGRQCIRTRGLYIYFKVPDSFAYEIDVDMTLSIEYFDDHVAPMLVQYDAFTEKGRSSYRHSSAIQTAGDRQWKTTAFHLPRAWLANGENQGADFRIAMSGGKPAVYRVTLSVDSLDNENYPNAKARRQALRDLKLKREQRITSRTLKKWKAGKNQVQHLVSALSDESRAFVQPLLDNADEAAGRLFEASTVSEIFEDDQTLRKHIDVLRRDTELVSHCTFLLERKVATRDFVRNCGKNAFDWVYFAQPAIDNVSVILPWTLPAPPTVNVPVNLQLCRGEFEPYGLGLISRRIVRDVEFRPTDLHGPTGSVIPASRVDLRIVKRWYQAGHYSEVQTGRELVPELLLYDDSILKADLVQQKNRLNFQGSPQDATTLQPFDLEPLSTKFLWLTVHAPESTPAGVYRGTIKITGKNIRDLTVPLRVEILPFDLEENPKIASMYYRQHVAGATGDALERYKRQLVNMRDHGLTDPVVGGGREELALRKAFGLNKGPLLLDGGFNIGKYMGRDDYTESEISELKATVDKSNALAEEFGYDGAYLYAIDEASGEKLAAEVPVFQMLEKLGGGAWAAVLSDFDEIAATDLQLPNYCGFPQKELVDKVHAAGHKIIRYASPQGGTEDPWQYRYRYGIVLWELNLDGGCTWTYQVAMGDPWNDFDGKGTYRDFMMTYPGAHGPIDTVQWEGYREGCDDLRYMATLEKALAEAKANQRNPTVVEAVEKWLAAARGEDGFNGDNLAAVRERIITQILSLRRGEDE